MFRYFFVLTGIFFCLQSIAQEKSYATLKNYYPYGVDAAFSKKVKQLEKNPPAKKPGTETAFYYHYALGSHYQRKQNSQKTIFHFGTSLDLAEKQRDSLKIGWSAYQLGYVYFTHGAFDSTYHYYIIAQLAFEHTDEYMYAHLLSNIGELYYAFDSYRNALTYFRQSLELKKKNKEWQSTLPFAYWSIAEAHYSLDKLDSAMYYYRLSSSIATKTRKIPYYGNEGIAQILIRRGAYDSALIYLEPVKEWYFKSGVPKWIADMGLLYMDIALHTGNDNRFFYWSEITQRNAYKEYLPEQQRRFHELMANYYERKKLLMPAFQHLRKAFTIREKNIRKMDQSSIDVLVEAFQVQQEQNKLLRTTQLLKDNESIKRKQKSENQRLENKNHLYSIVILLSFISILLMGMLVLLINRQRKKIAAKTKQLEDYNTIIANTISQLEAKEDRLIEMQMKSRNLYLVINAELEILRCNPAFQQLAELSGTSQHPCEQLDEFLSNESADKLRKVLDKLKPFESASLQWTFSINERQVYEITLINLTQDITVNGYLLQGKNITAQVIKQEQAIYQLTSTIKEKEQIINEVSQEAALTNLQLELKKQTMSNLWANMNKLNHSENEEIEILRNVLSKELHTDKHWNNFKHHFDMSHAGFFSNLKKKHPALTINEEKHCAYIKMKLSIKDVSLIVGVAPETVKKARQRLKKKLNINQSLSDYLDELSV